MQSEGVPGGKITNHFEHFEALGAFWELRGASGRLPGAPGGIWRKFVFFNNFGKIFIFDVFGDSVTDFVMKLDESSCPCGHVKSWNSAKIGRRR